MSMTPLDKQRKFRSNPEGHKCLCGNPAYKFTRNSWACKRCYEFELSYFRGEDHLRAYKKDDYLAAA